MLAKKESTALLKKLKVISNKFRFEILRITSEKEYNITDLSSTLKLSYTKCADYVTMLANEGLVEKIKDGKETKVRSKVKLSKDGVKFL